MAKARISTLRGITISLKQGGSLLGCGGGECKIRILKMFRKENVEGRNYI
jgi:hypothetical protein